MTHPGGDTPTQADFGHGDKQSKVAGDRVLAAHGAIKKQIDGITLTVGELQKKGWTRGPAAIKFYKVANEMIEDAKAVQKKLHEIHQSLYTMNRKVSTGSEHLLGEVDRLTKATEAVPVNPGKSYTI
jgi:hypothetical protein